MPAYDILYFGDTARTPYGSKSHNTVLNYSLENTEFLIEKGAKAIVIACNTASSVAPKALMEKYHIPVFEVITPAVDLAVKATKKKRIGIIGTRGTINSKIYEHKILEIEKDMEIYSQPCPLLVPLVEEGWFKRPETRMIVKKYLAPLKTRQIDTLILGCTHYPLLKNIISEKTGKNVEIIDSATSVAKQIQSFLDGNPEFDETLQKNYQSRFFVSDITDQFQKTAASILGRNILLEKP
jgi:glutamate racemase